MPGRCSIPGNELADQKAMEASSLKTSPGRPIGLSSAVTCIKRTILDLPVQHGRTAAVYTDYSEFRDRREVTSRGDATLLAHLMQVWPR